MPASAKRSQRGRRDVRSKDKEIAAADVESSSPSRPAKRRKKARSPDQSDSNSNNSNNNNNSSTVDASASQAPEPEQEPEPPSRAEDDQLVTQVTQQLKTQPVQASKDHSNAIHEANGDGVKAYAKVAAQDWTYYITKLSVHIGRAPEASHGGAGGAGGADAAHEAVHIDLGPSKMVSREHASISFNSKDEKWMLHVKGRNGAKVDGQPVKAQTSHALTSGEVIEIANVEMMFVLPSELSALHIHPTFLQRCGRAVATPKAASTQTRHTPGKADQKRPGTPTSTHDRNAAALARSPAAASTPGGLLGASGVDLSLDDNQHMKPQYSYAQMITQAILNAPDGKLNLNGIYNFIMSSYSYYRHQHAAGWQNSIRHNLSLNKSFDKVARTTDEPGKGMKWHIVPEARDEMVRNAFKIGRGGHRGSSVPSSPSQLNYITHGPKDMLARDLPSAQKRRRSPLKSPLRSPPQSSRRALRSTPDRVYDGHSGLSSALTADGSPLPRARKSTTADSPLPGFHPQSPTLTSSYPQDDNPSFVTPAPPRVHPKLAPPSTAQRPSQHMPTSSPAPFWKYADVGSTPLKPLAPYEVSPCRTSREAPTQSSSPPTVGGKSPPSSPSRPQKSGQQEPTADAGDEPDDEQGFDLIKGFQSIGAYHAPVGRGVPIGAALKGGS